MMSPSQSPPVSRGFRAALCGSLVLYKQTVNWVNFADASAAYARQGLPFYSSTVGLRQTGDSTLSFIPMRIFSLYSLAIYALSSFSTCASAITAEELELIPSSEQCKNEAMSLKPLYDRRDEGMTREQALALADGSNGVPISRRAVTLAFDFPKMPRDATTLYGLWSCHALSHYFAILPLGQFESEFEACYSKPTWDRSSCANILWNKVHRLPEDRKRGGKPVAILAPANSKVDPETKPGAVR